MSANEQLKTDPTKFLGSIIGSTVTVKLHNGVEYQGNLQSIDGYMNVVLESAKEFVNATENKSYGDVFIRGNNGMCPFDVIFAHQLTNFQCCILARPDLLYNNKGIRIIHHKKAVAVGYGRIWRLKVIYTWICVCLGLY